MWPSIHSLRLCKYIGLKLTGNHRHYRLRERWTLRATGSWREARKHKSSPSPTKGSSRYAFHRWTNKFFCCRNKSISASAAAAAATSCRSSLELLEHAPVPIRSRKTTLYPDGIIVNSAGCWRLCFVVTVSSFFRHASISLMMKQFIMVEIQSTSHAMLVLAKSLFSWGSLEIALEYCGWDINKVL